MFFPGRGETAGPARQVCAACPVRQPCLDYAITNRITYGIWGGLTERERRALRSGWVRASRRERDRAILAADAAGYAAAPIGRTVRPVPHVGDPGPVHATRTGGHHEPQPGLHSASVAAAGPRQTDAGNGARVMAQTEPGGTS